MNRYIGLDVHSQSCTLVVLGPTGRQLKVGIVDTNGDVLVDWLKGIAGRKHLCLEEGTQSAWLYETLRPLVDEIVVVQPSKRTGAKSDARDAKELAELLRTNAKVRRVYKGTGPFTVLRHSVRAHRMLVKDVARVKNRIKAVYRSVAIEANDDVYDPSSRSPYVAKLPVALRHYIALLNQELDALEPLRSASERQLEKAARPHEVIARLATAPGMGLIRSAQVAAVVVSPDRFRTRAQFWSYCGLAVVTRSSADWVRDGGTWRRSERYTTRGLNRNRHPLLKSVFKGAALTVITRMPNDPLRLHYEQMVARGVKPNLARLTLARRIAATVLSMWRNEEDYDPKRLNKKK